MILPECINQPHTNNFTSAFVSFEEYCDKQVWKPLWCEIPEKDKEAPKLVYTLVSGTYNTTLAAPMSWLPQYQMGHLP